MKHVVWVMYILWMKLNISVKVLLDHGVGWSGSPECWEWQWSLQWRHDERDGVSNHQHHECLLNRLFRRRSKKTPKLRQLWPVTGDRWPVNSPHKWPVTQKMFPFDDVIMYNDTWLIHMRGNNWYMNEKVGIKLNRHIILQYQVTGVMASGPKEHRMFVQQVVPANIKENTRALHYGPFVREIHRWRFTGGVPSQRASNAENVCTSHDVLFGSVHCGHQAPCHLMPKAGLSPTDHTWSVGALDWHLSR